MGVESLLIEYIKLINRCILALFILSVCGSLLAIDIISVSTVNIPVAGSFEVSSQAVLSAFVCVGLFLIGLFMFGLHAGIDAAISNSSPEEKTEGRWHPGFLSLHKIPFWIFQTTMLFTAGGSIVGIGLRHSIGYPIAFALGGFLNYAVATVREKIVNTTEP